MWCFAVAGSVVGRVVSAFAVTGSVVGRVLSVFAVTDSIVGGVVSAFAVAGSGRKGGCRAAAPRKHQEAEWGGGAAGEGGREAPERHGGAPGEEP